MLDDVGLMLPAPVPISIADIATILQYIVASEPIPPNLLSLPLLQRHFFLSITHHDPSAYLTWPSDDSPRALALLHLIRPEDLPDLLSTRDSIRYLADPDAIYAHVRFSPTTQDSDTGSSSSLRLIFLWDKPSSSWRYHNSAIGHFPANSHFDIPHAMALFHSPNDFLQETSDPTSPGDSDDAYWNTYGDDDQHPQSHAVKPSVTATEDAYWAQYSSIQGSADSTVPSPRPRDRKFQYAESDHRIFLAPSELNLLTEIYDPLAPPSPSILTRRLAALPTHADSPPLQEEDDPPSTSASPTSPFPQIPRIQFSGAVESVSNQGSVGVTQLESTSSDVALKATIRGLYQLWRSRDRPGKDFMVLVQQALDECS